MKNKLRIFAALILSACMLTTGCEKPKSDGANFSFDYAMLGHPESLDPQIATDECSLMVIGNLYTGLLERDGNGGLKNAACSDYKVSDDGLTYNFTIRNNCYWFQDKNEDEEVTDDECFPVTAYDFQFAFRRIFDPTTQSPYRETYSCIKNAEEIIKGDTDYNELGVAALSDNELVIQLDHTSPEFLNSLTLTPAMPCNEEFFLKTKGRYGLDDKSVISNGAFFLRLWFYDPYGHDNLIYMQRNLGNTAYDKIYPTNLNIYMKESTEDVKNSFENGESDVMLSFISSQKLEEENNIKKYDNYTLGILINPDKPEYGNKNIRMALAYGIDKESFDKSTSDDISKAYGLIPSGVMYNGKSYREQVKDTDAFSDDDGKTVKYDPDKASEFFRTGMDEMGKRSLENTKFLVPKDLLDTEYLHLVTQEWQNLFGIYIGIEEVSPEEFDERIRKKDYTLAIYPLTGTYNSPMAFIDNFKSSDSPFGYQNNNVDELINEIGGMKDEEEIVNNYREVEKTILNDFLFIPVFYKSEYEIMGKGNDDIIYDPFTKQLFFRQAKYYG